MEIHNPLNRTHILSSNKKAASDTQGSKIAHSINGSLNFYKTNTLSFFDDKSTGSIQFNAVTINMVLPTKFV